MGWENELRAGGGRYKSTSERVVERNLVTREVERERKGNKNAICMSERKTPLVYIRNARMLLEDGELVRI